MKQKAFIAFLVALLSMSGNMTHAADKAKNVTLKCKDMELTEALRQVERLSEYYKINYS